MAEIPVQNGPVKHQERPIGAWPAGQDIGKMIGGDREAVVQGGVPVIGHGVQMIDHLPTLIDDFRYRGPQKGAIKDILSTQHPLQIGDQLQNPVVGGDYPPEMHKQRAKTIGLVLPGPAISPPKGNHGSYSRN